MTLQLYLFGDDLATLYIDGIEKLNASFPQVTNCNISALNSFLAIRIHNLYAGSGFSCSMSYGGCITDTGTWRCTNVLYTNWNQLNYDDSSWPLASISYDNNGVNPQLSNHCPVLTNDKFYVGYTYCRHWL